jgi:hypothetical protein
VVSNLNEKTEEKEPLQSVQYGRGLTRIPYEIKSNFSKIGVNGIINMLNVIAKLLPDKILEQPWPTKQNSNVFDATTGFAMASQKLDRLFQILSTNDRVITWENARTNDKMINDYFVNITITINDKTAYIWKFIPGHFQITPLLIPDNDWRLVLLKDSAIYFANDWISSLYVRLSSLSIDQLMAKETGFNDPWIWFFGSHANLKDLDSAIEHISFIFYQNYEYKNLSQFMPLVQRYIDKSIPLNDSHALNLITLLMQSVINVPYFEEDIKEIVQQFLLLKKRIELQTNYGLNSLPNKMAKHQSLNLALILFHITHKFSELDLSGNTNITDDILAKLTNLTELSLSGNEKITDAGLINLTKLTDLNLRFNTMITDNGIKNLRIKRLNLFMNSQITERGLNVESLEWLKLGGTNKKHVNKITSEFIKAHPSIKVE